MASYCRLRHVLGLFDISVGLSDAAATGLLSRQLGVPQWRAEFVAELRAALADVATPWRNLLFNDSYEVYEFETEQEARDWVVSVLWNTACPGEPVPAAARQP